MKIRIIYLHTVKATDIPDTYRCTLTISWEMWETEIAFTGTGVNKRSARYAVKLQFTEFLQMMAS